MDTTQKTTSQIAIESLDAIYSELIGQTEELRDAFFQTALSLHEGKPGHVPIAIRIRQTSPNAKTIEWIKIIMKSKAKGKKENLYFSINKGVGSRYRVGSFSFVKEPLKEIVRSYEAQLADIREACSVNRRIRRQLVPHTVKVAKIAAVTAQVSGAA
ncbi:conjugative transfer protein MobI(A/C) [Pseudomonas sp. 2FE]|uniref:conjugative transfer protein MobI(A/C) n=1 Tax=Pseudomonas sp. 2FE TaxID=2502190 RepID=UPI0010F7BE14|nr:conjugative transfer protein MobI(A/C) [Pseudomonas sp. 2FE]